MVHRKDLKKIHNRINGLWDNVLNGFDKYSQLYTEWYAQVKFLKYFTYNFDFYYQDLRRERKVSDASIGKFSFSKGAYSTGADDPSTLYTRMYLYKDESYEVEPFT